MKHHLRHLLPLALLLVTLLLAVCVSAADSDYLTSENNDGTLTITGYAGSDTALVIPAEIDGKKVTTIGYGAFDYWLHKDQDASIYTNIRTITVSEGITTFELYSFSCLPRLTRIEIPKTAVSIATSQFLSECSKLREILVDPDNPVYRTIDNVLFNADCNTLITYPLGKTDTSYVIPEGVEILTSGAFNCNRVLSSLTLPESLTTIHNMALGNMNLTSLTIPANVSKISSSAFLGSKALSELTIDAANPYYANDAAGAVYTADMTELVCLPALSGSSYTCVDTTLALWDFALSNMQSLTTLHLPAGITTPFSASTFSFCDNLTDIYFGGTISQWQAIIGRVYTALNGVIIHYEGEEGMDVISGTCGNNLTWIKDAAGTLTISGEGEMQDYSTNETGYPWNDYIGEWRSLNDESGIRVQTTGIRKVVLEEGVTTIAKDAFAQKSSRYTYSIVSVLEAVELPSTLLTLQDYAFSYCDKLTEITIPKSVTTIALLVFQKCNSLENIYVEEGNARYRDIGGVLLSDKGVLKMPPQNKTAILDLSDTAITYIDLRAFLDCVYLEQILFPDTPDFHIDSMAFAGCTGLTVVSLPDTVTSIGIGAFRDCSNLTAITIPDGITSIENSTFSDCNRLTSVYFYGDAPTIAASAFQNTSPDLTLYYIDGKSGWTSPTWNGYNTATFVPSSKPTVPGDIDGNGTVDYFDVSALYAAYLSEEIDAEIMDINGDGVVDYFDVARLYAAFRGTISLGD